MNSIENRQKLNGLQALRGFAFLGIFLDHADLGLHFITGRQVSVFIVMSGFLLVLNYYEKDMPCSFFSNIKYSIGKIKRLYPLHIITMLCLFFLFLYFSLSDPDTFGTPLSLCIKAVLNLFLVQSFVPINSWCIGLNGVAWYLSTCIFLYFLFPCILRFIKKNYSVKKAIILSVSTYLFMIVFAYFTDGLSFAGEDLHNYLTYICPFYRAFDFFIGCNLGYLFLNKKTEITRAKATVLEIVMLATIPVTAIYITLFNKTALVSIMVSPVLWLPTALMAVWCFADCKGVICRFLSSRPFTALGDISAYAFLIHYVVLIYVASLLRFLFSDYKNNFVTAIISILLTVLASLIYRAVSDRLHRRLSRTNR